MFNGRQLTSALMVLGSRFLSLPANFSPLGGFGFFSKNAFLYLAVIVVHDFLKGGFYDGFWLTYLGFAMYLILGQVSQGRLKRQLLLLPTASFLFFIFSNLGVWWYWRDHSFESLVSTYVLALPFYRNTFLGDIIFGYGYLAVKEIISRGWLRPTTGIISLFRTKGEVA